MPPGRKTPAKELMPSRARRWRLRIAEIRSLNGPLGLKPIVDLLDDFIILTEAIQRFLASLLIGVRDQLYFQSFAVPLVVSHAELFGLLELFGFLIDGFPSNPRIFDVGVTVGKTAALFFLILWGQSYRLSLLKEILQFVSHIDSHTTQVCG